MKARLFFIKNPHLHNVYIPVYLVVNRFYPHWSLDIRSIADYTTLIFLILLNKLDVPLQNSKNLMILNCKPKSHSVEKAIF
jgi:hypothetical protein